GAAHVGAPGAGRGGRAVQLVEQRSRRVVRGQRVELRKDVEAALGGGGGVVDREVGIAAAERAESPDLREKGARAGEDGDVSVVPVYRVDVPGGLADRELVGRGAQRAGRGVGPRELAYEWMSKRAHCAGGGEQAGESKQGQAGQRQGAAPPGATPGGGSVPPDARAESLRRVGCRPMPAHSRSRFGRPGLADSI